MRLKQLAKLLEPFGVELLRPSSGSHWKFRRAGYRSYPVPAPKGMKSEIPKEYLGALCRCLDVPKSALEP